MTGIQIPGMGRPSRDHTPDERYPRLKPVPEKYSIIQAGIALFHENPVFAQYIARGSDGADDQAFGSNAPVEFHVRKYNFFLFAPPSHNDEHTREVVLNPSTIEFLNKNNMDWNKWTQEGVPFVAMDRARHLLEKFHDKYYRKEQENNAKGETCTRRKREGTVRLKRAEDIAFVARTMASLREWIDSVVRPQNANANTNRGTDNIGHDGEDEVAGRLRRERDDGKSLLLPPCNAFLRRALYETIELEYPSLILEKADGSRIRVLRLNRNERLARDAQVKREEWAKLHKEQLGFTDVFRALSAACRGELFLENGHAIIDNRGKHSNTITRLGPGASELGSFGKGGEKGNQGKPCSRSSPIRKRDETVILARRNVPIVVHNGLMDMLFLLTHCHSPTLPETYGEAKGLIHHYFPHVYDTKILATEFSDYEVRSGSTVLGDLFKVLCLQVAGNEENSNPITNATLPLEVLGEENPDDPGQLHEASYDALLTGAVFQAMTRRIAMTNTFEVHRAQLLKGDESVGADSNLAVTSPFIVNLNQELARKFVGKNKLYLMTTMYTIDLENDSGDVLSKGMLPDMTYRVSGIDSKTTTRDIHNAMKMAAGRAGPEILTYEIVWVDDFTFLVGTRPLDDGVQISSHMTSEERMGVMKKHGRIIEETLRRRFPSQTIVSLKQHLAKTTKLVSAVLSEAAENDEEDVKTRHNIFMTLATKVANVFFGKRGRGDGHGEERGSKRRRLA